MSVMKYELDVSKVTREHSCHKQVLSPPPPTPSAAIKGTPNSRPFTRAHRKVTRSTGETAPQSEASRETRAIVHLGVPLGSEYSYDKLTLADPSSVIHKSL